jgi:hypothetical protein
VVVLDIQREKDRRTQPKAREAEDLILMCYQWLDSRMPFSTSQPQWTGE